MGNINILSGNMLKIIAAITMALDHVGLMFFPNVIWLRVIGRLTFPIFAFMSAQGCKYTKNRVKYFSGLFLLGVLCQVGYYIFAGSLYGCILITFSLSVIIIYATDNVKEKFIVYESSCLEKILSVVILAIAITGAVVLNRMFEIDYGFWGVMVTVFASLFQWRDSSAPQWAKKLDTNFVHVISMGVGLCILSMVLGGIQHFSLFALPVLLFYSGKRGKWKMKWFFYVFYPLHLVVLEGIYMIVY